MSNVKVVSHVTDVSVEKSGCMTCATVLGMSVDVSGCISLGQIAEVPRILSLYVQSSLSGSNRVHGVKQSSFHSEWSVEMVLPCTLVYFNVGSFNATGGHDEILETPVEDAGEHTCCGSANTAGGRRGMMFVYTPESLKTVRNHVLCFALVLCCAMMSSGSELSCTVFEINPANAGECINAVGLVKPVCSTCEGNHEEVSLAVCVQADVGVQTADARTDDGTTDGAEVTCIPSNSTVLELETVCALMTTDLLKREASVVGSEAMQGKVAANLTLSKEGEVEPSCCVWETYCHGVVVAATSPDEQGQVDIRECKTEAVLCVHCSSIDVGPFVEDTTPDFNTSVAVMGTFEYDGHVKVPTDVMCRTKENSFHVKALGGALNSLPVPCGNNVACEVTYLVPSHYVTCVGTDTGTANL